MLTVVPTPLGNLRDITLRASDALAAADIIAAEDTRHTSRLLASLGLRKPMVSLHEHNEEGRVPSLLAELRAGKKIALVSDAGMPLVSDPGFRLVRSAIAENLPIEVLPGPSAVLTALVASGLPPHPFYFGGFLPVKSGRRAAELRAAVDRQVTGIYFESPHRIVKSLLVLAGISPGARVCVAREMTKVFEEFRRGTPSEIAAHYTAHPPKGEITLVLSGGESSRARPASDMEEME